MSSSESSSDDEDYEEEAYIDESLEIVCLFCDQRESTVELLLAHIKSVHDICLQQFCSLNKFSCLDYIKIINYIRSSSLSADKVSQLVNTNDWKPDEYLKPIIQNDALLTYGMTDSDDDEKDDDRSDDEEMVKVIENNTSSCIDGDSSNGHKTVDYLKAEIARLEYIIHELNKLDEEDEDGKPYRTKDDFFFWTYNHHEIHYEMLSDKVRTESYKRAILENSSLIEGKSCLDIGCGTGILSFFCASAGASKIVAVDQSEIIYAAMDISEENGISRKVTFRKGRVEDLDFEEKFDVIVSEWMGYFLLFEGMLDTIIKARTKLLKPNGLLLPSQASLIGAAVFDEQLYKSRIGFWDNVYGFRMSAMKRDVIEEVQVCNVQSESIISLPILLKSFDLYTCTLEEAQKVDQEFELKITKNGIIHAFVVWFDCSFNLTNRVTLTTSPHSEPTHWKQSLMFLEEPINVKENDSMSGRIIVSRTEDNFRSLRVKLLIGDKKFQKFTLM